MISFTEQISANEAKAVKLDREAEQYEAKARNEQDATKKNHFNQLAKVRRDDAARERKHHFQRERPPEIKIPNEISNSSLNNYVFQPSKNDLWEGTWELSASGGVGSFASDRGSDLLNYSSYLGVSDSRTGTRNSLVYDNIPYYNNEGNPRRFAASPVGLKLRYTHNEDRYGFQAEIRSMAKDTSFIGWNYFTNNLSFNSIQKSNYYWAESKINYFYQEELSYNQTIEIIFGIRTQAALIEQNTILPFSGTYQEYNEISSSLGPNIGFVYKKNFYGILLFSAGLELSLLAGGLEYNSLALRGQNTISGMSNFTKMELQKPILISLGVLEIYTKYDFMIGEQNRIGIGLNTIQSGRVTKWDQNIPLIFSNDSVQIVQDYSNFILRNLLYNQESQRQSRSFQIQYINLELTHVF